MTDAEKHCAGWEFPAFSGLRVAQPKGGDFLFAGIEYIVDDSVCEERDFWVGLGSIQHDFRGAKFLAPMDQRDLRGKARQECRFFHGGITATDHNNLFAAEEKTVAGRARGNSVPNQRLLIRKSKPTG